MKQRLLSLLLLFSTILTVSPVAVLAVEPISEEIPIAIQEKEKISLSANYTHTYTVTGGNSA